MKNIIVDNYPVNVEGETFEKNLKHVFDSNINAGFVLHRKKWDKVTVTFDKGLTIIVRNFSVIIRNITLAYDEHENKSFSDETFAACEQLLAERTAKAKYDYNCIMKLDFDIICKNDEATALGKEMGIPFTDMEKILASQTFKTYQIVFEALNMEGTFL